MRAMIRAPRPFPAFPKTAGAAALTAAALALSAPLPAVAQTAAFDTPADFSDMVAARLPAVVGILSTGPAAAAMPGMGPGPMPGPMPQLPPGLEEFFGMPRPQPPGPMRSQGSGFIISGDGLVVTNNHVIAGADAVEVVLDDERRFEAEVVGTDPATDIALLRIEGEDLPSVEWGSSEDLQIGDWVVAIGNPFGLGGTVTAGIVSARSRDINSGPYDEFIQTDAAINRGNSGGPLFDASGNVVGVNTAIFSPSGGNVGIGFAVPSRVAQTIVEELRDDGTVERGWLGVQIQAVDAPLAAALGLDAPQGVLVSDVTEGGPAAEAGLQPGDVILEIAGRSFDAPRDLSIAVAELSQGETVTVGYLRAGAREETDITIGLRPDLETASAMPEGPDADAAPEGPRIGVAAAPLDAETRAQFGIPETVMGVLVRDVEPGGPADEAGIRGGDVITDAGGAGVTGIEDLRAAVAKAAGSDEPMLVRIFREGGYLFLTVEVKDLEVDS
ncbi:trypsin-like peptidase domain-containing protein [Roseibacterium sp. SDUM158017]|uniref:trypsin-like peptidase domain-containing protein n=1 Tax=Roseicyclus salinarum TaxID=3036773 RepID=UPI0024150C53|nr:trypsin-like peptidase domain-containing protein [Roseibacterium sp. SDUM158017]MDG4647816.1 trypsin-like peptidase domain-containing protein [Roseibacterium sp. SDUM158017]